MPHPTRKGQIGENLQWIVRLVVAAILAGLLVAQVILITGQQAQPTSLELALYQQRLLYGPNGVFLNDDAVTPGVLNLERFNDRTLAAAYTQAVPRFAAKLSFYEDRASYDADNPTLVAEHEPTLVAQSLALAEAGLTGKGGGAYERHVLPVFFTKQDGTSGEGVLKIEVVRLT